MRLLTPEMDAIDLNLGTCSRHKYAVYDFDTMYDYKFISMQGYYEFEQSVVLLKIGKFTLEAPMNCSLLTGNIDTGELEISKIEDLLHFEHSVPLFNPFKSFRVDYAPVEIVNIYDKKWWVFPDLPKRHFLVVPLGNRKEWSLERSTGKSYPECIMLTESIEKLPIELSIEHIF